MGREVRMVPADWQHPKDDRGRYVPLLDGSYAEDKAEWDAEKAQWDNGYIRNYGITSSELWRLREPDDDSFVDWHGEEPQPEDYMPDWPAEQRTHLMMYETCTEGTPLSPAFATPEELARWLADNGASAFGSMTATYEEWLSTCKRGWAVSAVIRPGHGMQSGVEGMD